MQHYLLSNPSEWFDWNPHGHDVRDNKNNPTDLGTSAAVCFWLPRLLFRSLLSPVIALNIGGWRVSLSRAAGSSLIAFFVWVCRSGSQSAFKRQLNHAASFSHLLCYFSLCQTNKRAPPPTLLRRVRVGFTATFILSLDGVWRVTCHHLSNPRTVFSFDTLVQLSTTRCCSRRQEDPEECRFSQHARLARWGRSEAQYV